MALEINYNCANSLRAFLDQQGLGMRKKFGQNFLINQKVRQSLIDALDAKAGREVWEIGPGLGAMTAMLLEKSLQVNAFEIDAGFIRILKELFLHDKNFNLIEGDVMKTWIKQKNEISIQPEYLLGNLPYNIAAALLADFIENGFIFSRMVVTVQKETALRMAAPAGSPDYSSFSVLCSSVYTIKPLMLIKKEAFYPQPNVDSMGVLLQARFAAENDQNPDMDSCQGKYPPCFYKLVRALFASRRKTIKNNLTAFLSNRELCAAVLQENGINENERAENLELEAFLSLAKSIDNMRK